MSEAQNSQRMAELQKEMADLQMSSSGARARLQEMESEMLRLKGEAGENISWERVKLARHPKRPHSIDYIQRIAPDFIEIHGDRNYGDDPAIICGFGTVGGEPVMLICQEKGRDTKQKLHRNFGMPKPEGYRKAMRAMETASKFGRPIVTFLDTPAPTPASMPKSAAGPAIALNLREMSRIQSPDRHRHR